MIIYGWRGITSTKQQGLFDCPRCGGGQGYAHKSVRRWFTLYFLPIIPLDHVGEYVECQQCRGTFIPEVLSAEPEFEVAEVVADDEPPRLLGESPHGKPPGKAPLDQARRIFVLAALAHGEPRPATLGALESVCKGISDGLRDPEELRREVRLAQQARTDLCSFAGKVQHVFGASMKPKILAGAHIVLSAERGETQATEQLLRQLGQTLVMPEDDIAATLDVLRNRTANTSAGTR